MVAAKNKDYGSWDSNVAPMLDFIADALDSIKKICAMVDRKSGVEKGEILKAANELRSIKSISMFLGMREVTAVAGGLEKAMRDVVVGLRNPDDVACRDCKDGLLLLEKLLIGCR